MIHQPAAAPAARSPTRKSTLREALRVKKMLEEIMAKNTGQKPKIHVDMERDFWMTAEEAVKYGVVDKVIDTRKLADHSKSLS
jgi:ATP-dependent Clp protease protease subunit